MVSKNRRTALEAAASLFCATEVPAEDVLEYAATFEEYLAGGTVTLATDQGPVTTVVAGVNDDEPDQFPGARVRLLHQLANFVSTVNLELAGWLRKTVAALEASEPWPTPPLMDGDALAEARSWARHGYEIAQRTCSWSDHGVAPKWLTENHDPAALMPPWEKQDGYNVRTDAGAWVAVDRTASAPPSDVEVLRGASGAKLMRASWTSSGTPDRSLWQWFSPTTNSPSSAVMSWPGVLAAADDGDFPIIDFTTESRQRAQGGVPLEDYPVPEPKVDNIELINDRASSSKPERYEVRTIPPTDDEAARDVLVCLECIEASGRPGARGNITDVARHDAFHEDPDWKDAIQ